MLRASLSILVFAYGAAVIATVVGLGGPVKLAVLILGFAAGLYEQRRRVGAPLARFVPARLSASPALAGVIAAAVVIAVAPGWDPLEAMAVAGAACVAAWCVAAVADASSRTHAVDRDVRA